MPDRELEQPLSPELVLVSPDLRERACAEAPEPASGPPAEAPSVVAPVPAARAAPPLAAARAEPPPPSMPIEPPPPVAPALPPLSTTRTTAARVEWRLTVGTATVLALSALLVFGAGVAVGQLAVPSTAPRSAAPPESSQGQRTAPAPSPAAAAVPTLGAVPAPQSEPSAARPLPAKRASKPVRPISGAGYVFSGGRFQVSPAGRTVVGFTARTTCAGGVALPPVEVSPDGAFAFSGHPAGSPTGTTFRLTGRFVSQAEARGTMRVSRGTCHDATASFVARVS